MKEKILEAASELFANKGYQNTTVRDICQKAGIYQLSINYHFGSKQNLFREVILKSYQDTGETSLMEKIKDFSPENQLEEIIRTRVKSIFSKDKKGIFFKIIFNEGGNNCDLILDTIQDLIQNHFACIKDVFIRLSDGKFNDFELNYGVHLLMSHISCLAKFKPGVILLFNTKEPDDEQLEMFIQHVKKSILAGIDKMKEEKQ